MRRAVYTILSVCKIENDNFIKLYKKNIQAGEIEYVFIPSLFLYFFLEKRKESVNND